MTTLVDPVVGLVAAWARSMTGMPFVEGAVGSAAAALAAGIDGQALRELAGLSRTSADTDVRVLLERTLVEVGVDREVHLEFAQILVLREMTLDAIDGRIPVREVTGWAHTVMGHDGLALGRDLVALDDELDLKGDQFASTPEVTRRLEFFIAATDYLTRPDSWTTKVPRPDRARQDVDVLIERATTMSAEGQLRQAARLLKSRLEEDPSDDSVRRALAAMYRFAGHPDQAGRYEIAMPNSIRSERDAYARFLVSIKADEQRIRHLSALPDGVAIPERLLAELQALRRVDRSRKPWDGMAAIGSVAFVVTALLTVFVVYIMAVTNAEAVETTARLGGVVALSCAGIGCIGLIAGAAIEGRGKDAFGWVACAACEIVLVAVLLAALIAES